MTLTATLEPPDFDVDRDGQTESLSFVLTQNIQWTPATRTGFLTEGGGSTVIDILTDLADDLNIDIPLDGGRREGLYTDLGGGEAVMEIEAEITTGSSNQWGTGTDGDTFDATGASVVEKACVWHEVMQRVEIDSRPADGNYPNGHLATLSIGEYSEAGRFEPLRVVPEEPRITYDAERESSTATVSVNCIEAASLELPWDAQQQTEA